MCQIKVLHLEDHSVLTCLPPANSGENMHDDPLNAQTRIWVERQPHRQLRLVGTVVAYLAG